MDFSPLLLCLVFNYPTSLPIGRHKSLEQEALVPRWISCVSQHSIQPGLPTILFQIIFPHFFPPPLSAGIEYLYYEVINSHEINIQNS